VNRPLRNSPLVMLPLVSLVAVLSACELFSGGGPRTAFNGDSALAYTRAVVAFGPRVPGTQNHRRAGDWITQMMRARADTVVEQTWTHVTKQGQQLPLRNILARFRPAEQQRILYLTHWDTRPTADNEWNLGAKRQPILGANDGGSGVGLFIALADLLKKTPPNVGVDLLFVDGEDWGDFGQYNPDAASNDVLIGSAYFANNLPSANYRPLFGVLFDMIGDEDLNIEQEQHSIDAAPEVVSRVWQTAADLGYSKYFIPQVYGPITDDHLPLIRKGLRVINVIDIEYGPPSGNGANPNYHHTLQDTMDKISAKSLQIVGDVATKLVTGG
jgi:glutaminyl-peptide cyclotransferase